MVTADYAERHIEFLVIKYWQRLISYKPLVLANRICNSFTPVNPQ